MGALPLITLASRSPRRAALLKQIGIPFRVQEADVDESVIGGETPAACALRLAEAKARRVWAETPDELLVLPVLGADTIVVRDGVQLGKPENRADHLRMLEVLSNGVHQVLTAICIVTNANVYQDVISTDVEFVHLDRATISAYVDTGEGRDKAGGYGIQGLGGIFVKRLVGSYSAVVGLPLAETEALLLRSGLDTWQRRFHEI